MTGSKISIVIPNWNGKELLKRSLPAVIKACQRWAKTDWEIIIVDDASTDDSVAFLKKNFSEIKVIEKEQNEGYSSAVNRGAEQAQGEVVILLNTDVVPEKDFLVPLLRPFEDEKVFAVGCLEKSIENGHVIKRGRGIVWWGRGFLIHKRGEVDKRNTFWVSGGSSAFRKSIWEELGGMDELYNPFYWEDIDLSYRAQKAGYKVLFESKSIVVHKHEQGAIMTAYTPSEMKRIAYRNQFFFVWKNITDIKLIISHLVWLPYHFAKHIVSLDFSFYLGFTLALLNIGKIVGRKNQLREKFKLTDQEVINPDE